MGQLIDGAWHDTWYDTKSTGGAFVRAESRFRSAVTADGSSGFPVEAGRYHLYVAEACPWAHRTLIMRVLKGLEGAISVSTVEPDMLNQGWTFGEVPEPLLGASYLHQVYTAADPHYTGRVTVPVLWDKQRRTIVNNESAEIIRMLNGPMAALGDDSHDYYPPDLREAIDAIEQRVYERVNNGVYRAGFATTQQAYDEAFDALFAMLDELEERLAGNRYLMGDRMTEADIRLFTTLVRFDAVYYGHFKCNRQHIYEYPHLWGFTREIYQLPGVAATVKLDRIKRHYYASHRTINPTGVVPKGPVLDFSTPHGRDGIGR
jgi:putative glutathione S-transferase